MTSGDVSSKHTVTFLSPGTFMSESTTRPLDSWDTAVACEMATGIVERYNARPYAFYFTTSVTAPDVPDGMGGFLKVQPRQTARSGMHFLGGTALTVNDVIARRSEKDDILISNMRNNWPVVVESINGYLSVHPLESLDVIVDAAGKVAIRGDDPVYEALRAAMP